MPRFLLASLVALVALAIAFGCMSATPRRGRSTGEVVRTPRREDGSRTHAPRLRDAGVDAGPADAGPPDAAHHDAGQDAGPAPDPRAVRDTLRTAIDAHGAAVLACLGSRAGALDVRWDDAGVISLSLRPPHAVGEDVAREEECVRDALRDLVVPAGAAAGALIHALEAPRE